MAGMSSSVPSTRPALQDRCADARRIRIDEADDLDAEIVRASISRARFTVAALMPDEQQALARSDATG